MPTDQWLTPFRGICRTSDHLSKEAFEKPSPELCDQPVADHGTLLEGFDRIKLIAASGDNRNPSCIKLIDGVLPPGDAYQRDRSGYSVHYPENPADGFGVVRPKA